MFAAGLGHAADLAFAGASMLIAVPTGVKVFNWIATLWGGSLRFTTAMMFALGFLIEFVIGGLSGVTFAAAPIDWQVTDTYYVVAHFHYVLFGGTLFAVFAATYYWFPKMSGRLLSERWGKVHFWLTIVGFNLTFFVQHLLGLKGMPRRVFTYPDLPGWGALNLASTVGSFILALAMLVFALQLVRSLRHGAARRRQSLGGLDARVGHRPRPAAPHNFERVPPVRGRRPLWDLDASRGERDRGNRPPRQSPIDKNVVAVSDFIASEGTFFLMLVLAYVIFNLSTRASSAALDVKTTGIYTACLLASSLTLHLSERHLAKERTMPFRGWLLATIDPRRRLPVRTGAANTGGSFAAGLRINSSLFGTSFFTLTGFHGLHVTVGLVALGIVAAARVRRRRPAGDSPAHFIRRPVLALRRRGLDRGVQRCLPAGAPCDDRRSSCVSAWQPAPVVLLVCVAALTIYGWRFRPPVTRERSVFRRRRRSVLAGAGVTGRRCWRAATSSARTWRST